MPNRRKAVYARILFVFLLLVVYVFDAADPAEGGDGSGFFRPS